MVELGTWANVADIFGAIVVVGGIGFAVIQIRHLRLQRKEFAAFEVLRSVQAPEMRRAYAKVMGLPDGLGGDAIRALGPETVAAVEDVMLTFEVVGLMVFERTIHLRTVDRMMGGLVRLAWRRTSPFAKAYRETTGNGAFGEWFQWLAERLEEFGDPGKLKGAHILYRGWKP